MIPLNSYWYVDDARSGNLCKVVAREVQEGTERYTMRVVEARRFGTQVGDEFEVEPAWFVRRGVEARDR